MSPGLSADETMKLTSYKSFLHERKVLVDFLAILFGIGSWIGINSTFVQFPLLVAAAPEGWDLPSYIVVIIQLGNLGPLAYTLVQKYSPKKILDANVIYGILTVGCAAALAMCFVYDVTAIVGGVERSVWLFVVVFFLALVGCSSSVLFMPYMGRFREIYLITYLIGEGLSGFLPSILALIQGVGGNAHCVLRNNTEGQPEYELYTPPPRFETQHFFAFVTTFMAVSLGAFILLENLRICRKEYVAVKIEKGNKYTYDESSKFNESGEQLSVQEDSQVTSLSVTTYRILLILMAIICMFGNGIFPSIQSYSCLPYGNIAYHLTVTLSSIANPLACFLAVFLPHTSIRLITILSSIATAIGIYAVTTAVMSPAPPLLGNIWGEILVVISWTILNGLISYMKLSITSIFRFQGGKSLVWVGGVSQVGSFTGAILAFVLINYAGIFISYTPTCPAVP
ncbi:solute carrier family 52, riboflavin transporter, member 3-B-like [Phlebotomus papatasi]|uniref:solute carrier family 52, riboflavin transporter, member 3-B-like n=1 Tax=Phlebotomus papatasi TaxID=29031 RepID=UPI0024836ECB|nr:solute carrier family 52, riboflavin transporter, member 3-B-like [Phlebotomus papatasi]